MVKQIALAFGPIAAVLGVLLVIKASSADEKPKRATVTISLDDDHPPRTPPVPAVPPIPPIPPVPAIAPIPPVPPLPPHAAHLSDHEAEKIRIKLEDLRDRIEALKEEAAEDDSGKGATARALKLKAYQLAADALEQALEDRLTEPEVAPEPPEPPDPPSPP